MTALQPCAKIVLAVLLTAGLAGCGDPYALKNDHLYVKPTVAVVDFDSRAAFPLGWDLGSGMRDILVDRLLATRRFHVIERPELETILTELQLQNSGITRRQRRAQIGRLKNVQYLVRGTVTDFGHVSNSRGALSLGNLDISGGGERAVMSMTLQVIDVESGEILCSESLSESVRAGDVAVQAVYGEVGLGGQRFYRTPLGRATAKVIEKAVGRIAENLAVKPWRPRIAKLDLPDRVVLNGGRNRGVQVGRAYDVLGPAEAITDPETGDTIGRTAGRPLGRVIVRRVESGYAVAEPILGRRDDLAVGQVCRPVQQPEPAGPQAGGAEPRTVEPVLNCE